MANKLKVIAEIIPGGDDFYVVTSDNVGVGNQSLTAAIENLSNYVTPEMFGAKGDGVTDDGPAFKLALDSGNPVIVNADYLINSELEYNVTNLITGDRKHKLILNKNITLKGNAVLSNCIIKCNGGHININGSGVKINDNTFIVKASYGETNKALNIIKSDDLKVDGNTFRSDTNDITQQRNIAIYYNQGSDNEFMNSVICNNNFRIFDYFIKVDISDSDRAVFCAGVRVSNNTLISSYHGITLNCSDHWKIIDNIIDYSENPVTLISPNGLRILDNYIFSPVANTSLVSINKTSLFCEDVIISDNYFWNNNELRTNTNGIKIIGGAMDSVTINNNMFRFLNKGIVLNNTSLNGISLNNNKYMACVYSGEVGESTQVSNGFYTNNTVYSDTAYDFTNISKFMSPVTNVGIAVGNFVALVEDNSYVEKNISYNLKSDNPTILVEPFNNTESSMFAYTITGVSKTGATIRIIKTGTGAAVNLQWNWVAIG